MLKHQIFEPAQEVLYPDSLLIMPNEISAGLEDYHAARAIDLANETGIRVLAYERPMSGSTSTFDLTLRRYYTCNAAAVHESTAKVLTKLVDLENPKDLIIAGHSAGAAEAIGIVATELLAVNQAVVTDPPGVKKHIPIYSEIFEYGGYQLFKERNKPAWAKPNTSTNTPPEKPVSAKEAALRTLADIVIYSAFHRSDSSLASLQNIALNQPSVDVNVIFPELTFTASPKELKQIADSLNRIRSNFKVEIIEDQYHSYFNDYHRFGSVVRKALKSF